MTDTFPVILWKASRVKIALFLAVVAFVNGYYTDPSETPHPDPRLNLRTYETLSPTFMVGDSITAYGTDELRSLGASWEINAVPGRSVSTLRYYVAKRLQNPSPLKTLVVALGTNAAAKWSKRHYAAVVGLVPDSTRVVFVTTYRDPAIWGDVSYRRGPVVQAKYSKYMRQIAAERPRTCTAEWRRYVAGHRSLLEDGVHPKEGLGTSRWAGVVYRAVKGVC